MSRRQFLPFFRRLSLTCLEERLTPTLFTVTTAADAGAGSLRQAIEDANNNGGPDTIAFAVGTGPITITPLTALPSLTEEVVIDGTTQPGFAGQPIVELSGNGLLSNGLSINADACTIRGLVINDFAFSGIYVDAADNVIAGNYIGTDPTGKSDAGNGFAGVSIDGFGAFNNIIGGSTPADRNVISGNNADGISLFNEANGNFIQGNFIGTDVTGAMALANGFNGIVLYAGAFDNLIGTDADGLNDIAERNVISGNSFGGIVIQEPDTTGNVVAGNFIGTNSGGTAKVPNTFNGVLIYVQAAGNRIGGTQAAEGNLISGNNSSGVTITGAFANVVEGNRIGTDNTGTKALGNGALGVDLRDGASGNRIGGGAAGAGNLISGNNSTGIFVTDPGTTGNRIQGNRIGTDTSGATKLPNAFRGVEINFSASGNFVGTDSDGSDDATEGNLISGNGDNGVQVVSDVVTFMSYVWTAGNGNTYVVTPPSVWANAEAAAVAAGGHLASITSASEQAFANGTIQAIGQFPEDLWIGANDVAVEGTFTWTTGEPFGYTNWASGQPDNSLDEDFVHLLSDGTWNDNVGYRRAILEFTTAPNLDLLRPFFQAKGNVIAGNLIGTDESGSKALGNGYFGVVADQGSTATLIGGTTAASRNVVGGNAASGIAVFGLQNTGTIVRGNYVGTDAAGTAKLPNGAYGVDINFGAGNAVIGGTAAGAGNLISGNAFSGVALFGNGNVVEGNRIGTDETGTMAMGNSDYGLLVAAGVSFNRIGGGAVGARNVISGNENTGVALFDRGTRFNSVQGNWIGLDTTGAAALPNAGRGIEIGFGASDNLIGTNADGVNDVGERNVISGNDNDGVSIFTGADQAFQTFQWTAGNGHFYVVTPQTVVTEAEAVAIAAGGHLASVTSAGEQSFITGTVLAGANDKTVLSIGLTDTASEGTFTWTTGEPFAFANWQTGEPTNNLAENYATLNDGYGFGYLTDPAEKGKWATVQDGGYRALMEFTAPPDLVLLDRLFRTHDNVVAGNFIGTDVAGTSALGNFFSGVVVSNGAVDTLIGGTLPAARNIISGNLSDGLALFDADARRTLIRGNYIGTDPTGAIDVGNQYHGVGLFFDNADTTIADNIISGNDYGGIAVRTATGAVIQGNLIGTDAAGAKALGNGTVGFSEPAILVNANSTNIVIGGGAPGARNIISGNFNAGIAIYDQGTDNIVVAGNYIGVNAAGSTAVPNATRGIDVGFGATNIRIGTNADGVLDVAEANVISGNTFDGIGVFGGLPATPFEVFQWKIAAGGNDHFYVITPGTLWSLAEAAAVAAGGHLVSVGSAAEKTFVNGTIQAKYPQDLWIGLSDTATEGTFVWTDPASNPPGYFNWASGEPNNLGNEDVVVQDPNGTWNDVSARNTNRAVLEFTFAPNLATLDALFRTRNVTIAGNLIGTDAGGASGLANGFAGVFFDDAINSSIGGSKPAEANTIAFNGANGVLVTGANAAGIRIRGNAIRTNNFLGIDLGNNGITANDALDADTGPNGLQNFPGISSATLGPTTRVIGTLHSTAGTSFTVDFYASAAADPSGNGEGGRHLGSTIVTTNGSGDAAFDVTLLAASTAGEFITATATDAAGSTSEFSQAKLGTSAPRVSSVVVNNGANQRSRVTSLKVTFDQIVTLPGSPETAFQLKRQLDNAAVTLAAAVDNTGPGTVVTLTFTAGAVNSGSLADGRYTLTALAAQIPNLDGNSDGTPGDDYVLVGDPAVAPKLFRLFGDNDGDGDVDATDFGAFRIAFGATSNLAFDFDNDGDVDAGDFGAFRQRFGSSV